ncbi:SusC/RagA family TonB-linked outer membrane protein [Paraflavitalea soli]|nr:SusC/RagA family TonB-linked outer membrane protein [Paraflavitalea soli]
MRPFIAILLLLLLCGISPLGVLAQQEKIKVQGVVTSKVDNTSKAGVTISVGKKVIGTTDKDGAFTVSVEPGATLIFTFSGFGAEKKLVTKTTVRLEVVMAPKDEAMTEIVVQGFKRATRETTTGSTVVISGKQLQDVPVSNVMELLQGKVPGLNIQNNTGSPGSMGTVNLRGISSTQVNSSGFLTPTSPLFVIDGVPVDANTNYEYGFQGGGPGISPLALIPPEDIEQMEFLKDAAATSQYGSRGAYGVIIVTTKRGRSKIPIVSYSGSFFVNYAPPQRKVMGGNEERRARISQILNYDTSYTNAMRLINSTSFLSDSLNPYYNNSTDWQDLFFRSTRNQTHNVNISGGDQTFNYKTNLNYYSEEGIMRNTGFKRYTLGMDALYQPSERFRMVTNLKGSMGQRNNGSGLGLEQVDIKKASNLSSLLSPAYYADFNQAAAGKEVKDDNKSINLSTSLDIQYEPIKGLRLSNLFTYNIITGSSSKFRPSFINDNIPEYYSYNDKTYTLYDRAAINYIRSFGRHNLNVFAFNELSSYGFRANAMLLSQTANDQIEGPVGYNWTRTKGGTLNNAKDTRIHGYGGTIQYNFDTKYVIDFSYRLDGTSTNGPSTGYTQNPSISARWNFNRENFFADKAWLSYGSLRASWGKNIVPTGSIFDVFGTYRVGNNYNDDPTVYIDWGNIPNDNFKPQTKTKFNLGAEIGLFNNAINATFETYYESLDNEVVDVKLSTENGFSTIKSNARSIVNYGFEWMITGRLLPQGKPLQWTIGVTGAYNNMVLTQLPNNGRQLIQPFTDNDGAQVPLVYRLGKAPFSNLVYNNEGVYASTADVPVNPQTGLRMQNGRNSGVFFQGGDPIWTDINGDYVIDEQDLVSAGNPVAKINGGINSMLTYKNWTLAINASYTLMRDLLNVTQAKTFQNFYNPTSPNALVPISEYDFWKPGADKTSGNVAKYPNPFDFRRAAAINPYRADQTLFMEDGSYWKINNVTFKYNFNRNWTKRMGITSANVYVTFNNVYTFSNYSGPDPELVTQLGRDNSGGYPNRRSMALGANIQF